MRRATLMVCVVILVIGGMTSVFAAGESEEDDDHIKIGFAAGFSGNAWRTQMHTSLLREAERHPDVELIMTDAQGEIAKQVSDVENLLAQGVDVIMTNPNSGEAMAPVLRRAIARGVPVMIMFSPMSDTTAYTTFVGRDVSAAGRRWAQWLTDQLGGSGNVVFLGGIPGNPSTAAVFAAAEEVFADTDINILAKRDTNWQEDRAKIIMADLISAYPQIDGVLCDGGQNAAGALKALLDAGRPLVPATGDDYNGMFKFYANNKEEHPNLEYLSIADATKWSADMFQLAIELAQGVELPKQVYLEPTEITGDEIPDYAKMDLPDAMFVDTDLPDDVLADLMSQ